jgi:hypothetical protein
MIKEHYLSLAWMEKREEEKEIRNRLSSLFNKTQH